MALAGVELESVESESDVLTTRPTPCSVYNLVFFLHKKKQISKK